MNGFLLDENLPRNLTFTPSQPVIHSGSLGISPSDAMLWKHALENRLVIISKDADFSDRIMISEPPPWVIHLRFGNLRRNDFHALLARAWAQIEDLLPTHKLICVYRDRIESFRE
ncbi:MAG: DUF5615 family PIN-like protein [Burkholderiales bacterium]|nr:DUF5615 family PIN-like protein [Phycisphaerae bacterium]